LIATSDGPRAAVTGLTVGGSFISRPCGGSVSCAAAALLAQADPITRPLLRLLSVVRQVVADCQTAQRSESNTARETHPAITAPTIGATQNSHSCSTAQPPTNSAGPVLRAGFTEVLVTGMLIR
jgi:hypothetical protein